MALTERVELKYCVPPDVAAGVLRIAACFLEPDDHEAGAGRQTVTSLYLDTPDLLFLRWARQGVDTRLKLRLRAYGTPPAAPVFAETKRRVRGVGSKERTRLASAPWSERRACLPLGADAVCGDGRRLTHFDGLRLRYGAEPKILIRYDRTALRGRVPGDPTAVTVDSTIRCQRSLDLSGSPGDWRRLPLPAFAGPCGVVVELKRSRRAPVWMARLEEQLRGWRRRFSKYGAAMALLHPWECS